MNNSLKGLTDSYYEKPQNLESWSGLPLKEIYTMEDTANIDYHENIGDAGCYPYTRGIHSDMFRGRYWTKREVCGFGSPADTNRRLQFQIKEGVGGLNIIMDIPGHMGIDADHPRALGELGVTGVNLTSLLDMEALLNGIPIDEISMSLITTTCATPVHLAQYIAVAEKRGINPATLKGTIQNDPIHFRYCGFREAVPYDLALKTGVDCIEYLTKNIPAWYTTTVNMYDLREQGITAPQEIAFGLSMAMCYIEGALDRGLMIDEFAPRMAFYCSSHIDFFEEVAKLRAARKLWAKILKEKYGASKPQSLKFKFAVHTAGCSLMPQQPLNNVIRVAYEALAAILAGVQSLHCCSYDEPIALPTEESQRLALRTQQILAYETGVANVSDPLGGSYYLESLTKSIEEDALKIIQKIEEIGGMAQAIKSEWLDREMEREALERQREIDRKRKILVGVNEFCGKEEKVTPGGVQRIPQGSILKQIEQTKELKRTRDQKKVLEALRKVKEKAIQGPKENLLPITLEAVKAYATTAEIVGTIREVYGYHYDPLKIVNSPFKLS